MQRREFMKSGLFTLASCGQRGFRAVRTRSEAGFRTGRRSQSPGKDL